jgi:hypothetical protein
MSVFILFAIGHFCIIEHLGKLLPGLSDLRGNMGCFNLDEVAFLVLIQNLVKVLDSPDVVDCFKVGL